MNEHSITTKLWNPNAAAIWSLLLSPVFGAWVHAKNWKALGKPKEAKTSLVWVYLGMLSLVASLFIPVNVVSIYFIIWYFSAGRKQAAYVKLECNNDYEKNLGENQLGMRCWASLFFVP